MRLIRKKTLRIGLLLGLLLLALVLSGCQTLGYYGQAVRGQFQIWHREQPIAKVIANPQAPELLKAKLNLVRDLRAFAAGELRLPVNGQYQQYADLGRRFVVWNVYAAPELSLEPKRWWYPFVGRLEYRGFFSEPMARECAARLAKKGYDVHVGGVEAYSTLGWFHDPVLNTFIYNDESDLAETLFHELAHQRVFASGDTDFNEAFATAVAEEGVRRWFRAARKPDQSQEYLAALWRNEQFVYLVMQTRAQLKAVYGTNSTPAREQLSDALKRKEKARILAELRRNYEKLKTEWGGYGEFDDWFAQPLNNARLNTIETYYRYVPAFQQLLAANQGQLERFYLAARALAKLPKAERETRLAALLQDRSTAAKELAERPSEPRTP